MSNVSPPPSIRGQSPEDSPSDEDSTMFKFSSGMPQWARKFKKSPGQKTREIK